MCFCNLDSPRELSQEDQRKTKPPVSEIRVKSDGSFECGYRALELPLVRERHTELGVSKRNIGRPLPT